VKNHAALPIVALVAIIIVVAALVSGGGEPSHLVIVRFDPRVARAEPAGTATPRVDDLASSGARLTWTARSDALQAELEGLAARLGEDEWTVQVANVLDVALANAAAAKERGDPGPYFIYLNLAAGSRADLGAAVGRVIDGLAAVLPPAETVFVIVDPRGGAIVAHGPGVQGGTSDPKGDSASVLASIEGWAGL